MNINYVDPLEGVQLYYAMEAGYVEPVIKAYADGKYQYFAVPILEFESMSMESMHAVDECFDRAKVIYLLLAKGKPNISCDRTEMENPVVKLENILHLSEYIEDDDLREKLNSVIYMQKKLRLKLCESAILEFISDSVLRQAELPAHIGWGGGNTSRKIWKSPRNHKEYRIYINVNENRDTHFCILINFDTAKITGTCKNISEEFIGRFEMWLKSVVEQVHVIANQHGFAFECDT